MSTALALRTAEGTEAVVESRIYIVRGQKVLLSPHLAELYEVEPRTLVQAVKRNIDRFPRDFMFKLTWAEVERLKAVVVQPVRKRKRSRSQIVILKRGENLKFAPYAFTEQGVAMLSSVLNSKRAIRVNISIMRTFVRLRGILASHKDLARRLDALEDRYDSNFKAVFDAIRALMEQPEAPRKKIGFNRDNEGEEIVEPGPA